MEHEGHESKKKIASLTYSTHMKIIKINTITAFH